MSATTQGSHRSRNGADEHGSARRDRTSYDVSRTRAIRAHDPDRLATAARIFGLTTPAAALSSAPSSAAPAAPSLPPMAMALPESQFVGVDLSQVQIAEGIEKIERVGCTNLELRRLSILDLDALQGSFDYILCHGVYSWVLVDVRERILEICRRHLSPTGVAYVSYNIYPGWRLPMIIRDLMLYHVQRFTEPAAGIAQARAVLEFLAHETAKKSPYRPLFEAEAERVRGMPDSYLFHEHLEAVNTVYSRVRSGRERRGLSTLAASTWRRCPFDLSAERARPSRHCRTLIDVSSTWFRAQPAFRRTLLCHAGVPLDRAGTGQLGGILGGVRTEHSSRPEGVEFKRWQIPPTSIR